VEDAEARHALGDDPAEAVGVDVEEGEVGEQAQLRGQVPLFACPTRTCARLLSGTGHARTPLPLLFFF
jgi:hypothetical protein